MNAADSSWDSHVNPAWEAALKEFRQENKFKAQKAFKIYKEAVLGLVTDCEENSKSEAYAAMGDHSRATLLGEFHVVSLGGRRQSGKTETIVQLCGKSDLIVSYNTQMAKDLRHRLRLRFGEHIPLVVTAREAAFQAEAFKVSEHPNASKAKFKRIWIDDANMTTTNTTLRWRPFLKWVADTHPEQLPTIIRIG